jgi:hypothetical protein
LTGGHEEPIAFNAAETAICADFRKVKLADDVAIRREDVNAIPTITGTG